MITSEIEVVRKAHLAGKPCQIKNSVWTTGDEWQDMKFTTSSYHWEAKDRGICFQYRIKPETKKETNMTAYKPHKHATVIKAWADGKKIQYRDLGSLEWTDAELGAGSWLRWFEGYEYRVKPEPVKDFIKYIGVGIKDSDPAVHLTAAYNKLHRLSRIEGPNGGVYHINNTLKLTINGKTRKVTSVEIL